MRPPGVMGKGLWWVVIGTQALFTASDLLGRWAIRSHGFRVASFLTLWFLAYTVIRQVATFGQLYVMSQVELGRTMAWFGACSIVLSNVLGFLLLREQLAVPTYLGVSLAVVAFLVLALWPCR